MIFLLKEIKQLTVYYISFPTRTRSKNKTISLQSVINYLCSHFSHRSIFVIRDRYVLFHTISRKCYEYRLHWNNSICEVLSHVYIYII